jgi:hypothetical protein
VATEYRRTLWLPDDEWSTRRPAHPEARYDGTRSHSPDCVWPPFWRRAPRRCQDAARRRTGRGESCPTRRRHPHRA